MKRPVGNPKVLSSSSPVSGLSKQVWNSTEILSLGISRALVNPILNVPRETSRGSRAEMALRVEAVCVCGVCLSGLGWLGKGEEGASRQREGCVVRSWPDAANSIISWRKTAEKAGSRESPFRPWDHQS